MKSVFFLLFFTTLIIAQSSEVCLDCHIDTDLIMIRNDKKISLLVKENAFAESIHSDLECIECHTDFNPNDLPHKPGNNIAEVDCSERHETGKLDERLVDPPPEWLLKASKIFGYTALIIGILTIFIIIYSMIFLYY